MNSIEQSQRNAIVARAKASTRRTITYQLGAGGIDPKRPGPDNVAGKCDCSGAVSWALGISRKTDNPFYVKQNGGWIETTAVAKDANSSTGLFTKIANPVVGCVVVYGDKGGKQGHIGLVSEVKAGKMTKVIHCSPSNGKGTAWKETDPEKFLRPDAIFAIYGDV